MFEEAQSAKATIGPLGSSSLPTNVSGRWYVAHTRSRQEKKLAQDLDRFGIPHYLPTTARATRSARTRRMSRSLVPIFPGYVFFNGTDDQRYQALTTNRIANVLEVHNQDQLVTELMHLQYLLASECEFSISKRLKVGDWGRIIAGPLGGVEGVVEKLLGRWRLYMNVTILGQCAGVEVEKNNVEKIDPPPCARETGKAHSRRKRQA